MTADHDLLTKDAEAMQPLADELIQFAFHRLREEHEPDNSGAIFAALLRAWIKLACSSCHGCARNLLWAGRNAITDRRERLSREHAH